MSFFDVFVYRNRWDDPFVIKELNRFFGADRSDVEEYFNK